jgi:hypothetical protein
LRGGSFNIDVLVRYTKIIIYNFAVMKTFQGKLAAVLGTIILHLLAGILFMSFSLNSMHNEMHDLVEVQYIPEELIKQAIKEKPVEKEPATVEKVLQGDQEMMNIAKNLANKADPRINKEDYIDKVKEELIKSGKLGKDNYIDDQKKNAMKGQEEISFREKDSAAGKPDKPDKSQDLASRFQGPTRIYYNLPNRTHTYLPLPIYKCQGQGKVVLAIEVTQKGVVEKAEVLGSESTTSDQCLIETAVSTALESRFNGNMNAPKIQTGTLTYQFVAQ